MLSYSALILAAEYSPYSSGIFADFIYMINGDENDKENNYV